MTLLVDQVFLLESRLKTFFEWLYSDPLIWLYSDPFDYSDLKWPDEENEIFSIEQRNQYDLVDGGKFF